MDRLLELAALPGPSGSEGPVADYVEAACRRLPGVATRRVGDVVIAARGQARTGVIAHMDTVGFTLGYGRALLPIGHPAVKGGEALRSTSAPEGRGTVDRQGDASFLAGAEEGVPGSAWIYADPLRREGSRLVGPYLDNRAGVWNALTVLERAPAALVVFTTGEEHSGRGALIAARALVEEYRVTQALISDITWHTDHVHCGRGPAVSRRDRFLPRRAFLERVLAAAEASGVPYQQEIEGEGSSDGGWIERSGYPVDWVFVGAPQKYSHTTREEDEVADL
jgi:putative aminopeptidase FrvX